MIKYFKLLPKTNINFIGARKVFFILSGIIMLACLGSVIFKGMNYGLDFTGGTMVQAQFKADMDIQTLRKIMSDGNINADIQTFVGKNAFSIKVKGSQEEVNGVSTQIETALNAAGAPFEVESKDFVGPTVGNYLAKKAVMAFVLAMAAMIIYIGFRFQNIIWGGMAVVALFHDVLLAVGVFSIMRLEVDLIIVAALLTIAGFSVNDTIVVFDRVRENIRLNPKAAFKDILNVSVNETLSRTIITSLTVVSATVILFISGGDVLRNFSFAMLIGLTSGVYTTMCLVPGLVYQWTKDGNYTALAQDDTAGVAHNARHGAAGFEQPKKKNKKRHG